MSGKVPTESLMTYGDAKGRKNEQNRMSQIPFAPGRTLSDPRREKRRDQCI